MLNLHYLNFFYLYTVTQLVLFCWCFINCILVLFYMHYSVVSIGEEQFYNQYVSNDEIHGFVGFMT